MIEDEAQVHVLEVKVEGVMGSGEGLVVLERARGFYLLSVKARGLR